MVVVRRLPPDESPRARPANAVIWEVGATRVTGRGSLVTLAIFFAFAKLDPANLAAHGLG